MPTNNSSDTKPTKAPIDVVCGMEVDKSTLHQSRHQGINYYFCSESCLKKFDLNPGNYIKTRAIPISAPSQQDSASFIDPVCGMTVSASSQYQLVVNNTNYYFCCASCASKFKANPALFLNPPLAIVPDANQQNQLYSCPMHPEIEKMGPGSCPICGMALDPIRISKETENEELIDFTHRFKYGLLFTVPLILLSMGDMVHGISSFKLGKFNLVDVLQLLLASPVVLWVAFPFLQRSVNSFKTGYLNMFSLIGLGVTTAYLTSLFILLFPGLLPHEFNTTGSLPLYFEAAAVIVMLVLLGQILELRGREKTQQALHSLLALTPTTATRISTQGIEEEVNLDTVQLNDFLRVKPGAQIPVDGILVNGFSWVDESMLTGEAMTQEKSVGSKISAGTINQTGSFIMQAKKVGNETLLANIIQLVGNASRSRANIQQLADRVSAWFVPFVIVSASASATIWIIMGASTAFALMCLISVLLIACPCALGLATPISITVAVGRAAKAGILVKNANSLEQLAKVTTLVIDKTGTLTEGKPQIQHIQTMDQYKEDDVLKYAAALEKQSEHPLANSFIDLANKKNLLLPSVDQFESVTGLGVKGVCEGHAILIGSIAFLKQNQCAGLEAHPLQSQPNTSFICLAIDSQLAGTFELSDQLKEHTQQTLQQLREAGLDIILLTGDNISNAEFVAKQCNIETVFAGLLPADKHHYIEMLQQQGKIVAMAGDGINDAPALAQAQIGIAMGNGSDIAMQSADIILVKGDLRGILKARQLSLATMKNIRQNLFFAFVYNFAGIPVAAGVFYPWFGLLLNPMFAAAAMSFSSITVISNALRLRRIQL